MSLRCEIIIIKVSSLQSILFFFIVSEKLDVSRDQIGIFVVRFGVTCGRPRHLGTHENEENYSKDAYIYKNFAPAARWLEFRIFSNLQLSLLVAVLHQSKTEYDIVSDVPSVAEDLNLRDPGWLLSAFSNEQTIQVVRFLNRVSNTQHNT